MKAPRNVAAFPPPRAPVRTAPLLAVLCAGALAACGGAGPEGTASEAASPADSIVDAWIEAAGGLEAWRSLESLRYTVTTVWYDSTGEVRRMRPRRVELRRTDRGLEARIERPEAEGLYVQVFNGDTAWATLNRRPLPADHPAAAESEYVGRDVGYWIGLPFKLRDPGVNREARRLDRGGWEVRITFGQGVGAHPGDRYFYLFTDDDPFPEEVHYIEQGRETRYRMRWSDFRRAGPLAYVGTRAYVDAEGRPTVDLLIDDVSLNPGLEDSLFDPPAR